MRYYFDNGEDLIPLDNGYEDEEGNIVFQEVDKDVVFIEGDDLLDRLIIELSDTDALDIEFAYDVVREQIKNKHPGKSIEFTSASDAKVQEFVDFWNDTMTDEEDESEFVEMTPYDLRNELPV